jgi:hypothetical protein
MGDRKLMLMPGDRLSVEATDMRLERCDRCRHWTPPEKKTKRFDPAGYGVCGVAYGFDGGPLHSKPVATLAFASAIDVEDPTNAELRTMAKHCCSQWTEKEAEGG